MSIHLRQLCTLLAFFYMRSYSQDSRFRRGELIGVIMNFLECRNIRDLEELSPRHPSWMRVRGFLKNVKVEVATMKRKIKITDLEPRAGQYVFSKDGQQIDVKV